MKKNAAAEVLFVGLSPHSSLDERVAAMQAIAAASGVDAICGEHQKIAVKTHIGERNNDTHIAPEVVRVVVERIKERGALAFLCETSTLYKGQRSNAVDHVTHAAEHGFTVERVGAPFIMVDGLNGTAEMEVKIPGEIYDRVSVAREILFADALVTLSHPTGHDGMGMGACIKNVGMGLASRMGKLRMHSSMKPEIEPSRCTLCGACIRWCPVDAIVERKGAAFIIPEKCIGCGECLAVCNFDAVKYNWGTEAPELQRRTAEHALGVLRSLPSYHFNVLADMTAECDCYGAKQKPLMQDVGILGSADPVALDQATLDLTAEAADGANIVEQSHPHIDGSVQLAHGEKIGLGSRAYRLTEVSL